jgi:hypothetical protein
MPRSSYQFSLCTLHFYCACYMSRLSHLSRHRRHINGRTSYEPLQYAVVSSLLPFHPFSVQKFPLSTLFLTTLCVPQIHVARCSKVRVTKITARRCKIRINYLRKHKTSFCSDKYSRSLSWDVQRNTLLPHEKYVRSAAFTAVTMESAVFWNTISQLVLHRTHYVSATEHSRLMLCKSSSRRCLRRMPSSGM